MALRKDVLELLSRLPGRYASLESVRFLNDAESFYRLVPKSKAEIAEEVRALLAKYPGQFSSQSAHEIIPKTKVEWLRPAWLGPEPTINRLSDVPVHLSDAFEFAQANELLDVYWDDKGDADVNLNAKGRAALAAEQADEAEQVPLLERVLAVLTPNQGRIVIFLWEKKTASYETLRTIPGAWRDVPSHEAITGALKKIRTRLDKHNLSVVTLTISDASQRVNLDRPAT
jgi:hypothetical protein